MDTFIEYMIKQKKKKGDYTKAALIILAATFVVMIVTLVFLVLPSYFISMWPLTVAGIYFGAYKIISSFDVEYEYILTNGELDVDRITHRKKRKRIITIHVKSFIEFGKIGDENEKKHKKEDFTNIINASANSSTYTDYYAVFFKNGQRMKLIFNPTVRMIDAFKPYAPRVVL
ncbi:MAG: hypothetical protein IKV88_00795 [Clostridia bacterium]|nr:hypothetical protein [Clostridia bacterium]